MRQLVIGIDAAQLDIFKKFEMPFLHSLLGKSITLSLSEDLINRGWAKIFTGRSGEYTKGLYFYPDLQGGYRYTDSCTLKSLSSASHVVPLWELLNSRGVRTGIMNIPTTSPAPSCSGFFVSGGGGGASRFSDVPSSHVFPLSIKDLLDSKKYVIDIRLLQGNYSSIEEYFSALTTMTLRRTDSFKKLVKNHPVDFGFICFRSFANLHYLLQADIQQIIEGKSTELSELLISYFKMFDTCLEGLFSFLEPKQYILVADHGMAPLRKKLNLNAMLLELGFQKINFKNTKRNRLVNKVRLAIPPTIKSFLKKSSTISKSYYNSTSFDRQSTKAFSLHNIPGIFLNDEQFGHNLADREQCEKDIIDAINSSALSASHNITAVPISKYIDMEGPYSKFFPDIYIEKPEDIYITDQGGVLDDNRNYLPLKDISGVYEDNWSGTKSRTPLCIVDEETGTHIHEGDVLDLTLIYKLVDRSFS